MSKQVEKCYMCDEDGITVEHVPPKCLFPEKKDSIGGVDLKKQLITVPACHEHNTKKSNDDVYFQFVITANILTNIHAEQQVKTKIKRAIDRTSHVYQHFIANNVIAKIDDLDREEFNTIAFKIDNDRLFSSIDHIAYGIYYHEYGQTFTGTIDIAFEGLLNDDVPDLIERTSRLIFNLESLLSGIEWKGENPEIFQYKIDQLGSSTYLLMKFYESLRITAVMH